MIATRRKFGPGRLEPTASGYLATWTDAGGTRRRRILSTDKRVAERAFVALVRERDLASLGLGDEGRMDTGLADLRERYLADLRSHTKPDHVRRIAHVTEKLIEAVKVPTVLGLRPEAVLQYRQRRIQEGAAARTINLEVGGFRSMIAWAVKSGIVPKNPLANLTPLPAGKAQEKRPRRALTRDEIERLLKAAEAIDARTAAAGYGCGGLRIPQAPLWRALIWTGARWGELTSAKWADLEDGTLRLRASTTKNGKPRVIPLVSTVARDLDELRALHGDLPRGDGFIFLGPRGKPVRQAYRRALYRFHELLAEAGISGTDGLGRKLDIHALRHTFASELGRAGVGLTQAQVLLGHSDPRLTAQIYMHLGVDDLRGAVGRLQAGRAGSARTA